MLLGLWVLGFVFCATVSVGVHLGFAAVVGVYKIKSRILPPIASQPQPEPDWPYITHRDIELAIPQRIAVQIAIAVDRAAERVDRPLAPNVDTEGIDIPVPGDRSTAVPCTHKHCWCTPAPRRAGY